MSRQHGLLSPELSRALLDQLFQTLRRLGALGQQQVAFDRVLAKHLDRSPHRRDLVPAGDGDRGRAAATGDLEHRTAQQVQPPHDVTADIAPHDQDRGKETERPRGR